jgi:hypothetical protein
VRANTNSTVKKGSKYSDIWDLGVLLNYIRGGPPPEELQWEILRAQAAAIFMIFVPCRPAGMFQFNPFTAVRNPDGGSIKLRRREKINTGLGLTEVPIHRIEGSPLCPVRYFDLMTTVASKMGSTNTFWCTKAGKPLTRPDAIRRDLNALLRRVKIPDRFKPYSIRHALITALYRKGLTESEVNVYTGHSHRSHTTLNYYYHLDKNWVGASIANSFSIPESVQRALQADDSLADEEDLADVITDSN